MFGKNGLVVLRILLGVRVLDVGGQGKVPILFHDEVGVCRERHAKERTLFKRPPGEQLGLVAARQMNDTTNARFFADPHVNGHLVGWLIGIGVGWEHALDQQFDLTARGLFSKEASFQNLGVVEDQQVTLLQELGQVIEMSIHKFLIDAVQEFGSTPGEGRVLGDQLLGEFEVKVLHLPGASWAHKGVE